MKHFRIDRIEPCHVLILFFNLFFYVSIGDIFELDVARPWEFNTSFPMRSVAVPFITVGLPYQILKWISAFTSFWLDLDLLSPYVLLVLPRLATACLSLICDFSLWHMCHTYGQNYTARLMIFGSSYAVLVFGSRTFSNTTEMILLAVLLALVLDSMRFSDEVIVVNFVPNFPQRSARTVIVPNAESSTFFLERCVPTNEMH